MFMFMCLIAKTFHCFVAVYVCCHNYCRTDREAKKGFDALEARQKPNIIEFTIKLLITGNEVWYCSKSLILNACL